jgi:error-prone DNA polymerase
VEYPHPALQPVLERTLGVPLFQEQLLSMAIIAAGFTGGEGEELRRAFGFKRSEKRMKEIEIKLRAGMTRNGIGKTAQDQIVHSITSFALYGFPESHAISFALIAYASAWLKCHYLAAFTAAIMNNQPMGFYSPATLVKDAQHHGLKVKPIDVTKSGWKCTLEDFTLRVGLRYVRGLRQSAAEALLRERARAPFVSVGDLARRVPELQKSELVLLAEIGALNFLNPESRMHRRDALWQVERAARPSGPLLQEIEECDDASPLRMMNTEERIVADFNVSGMTVGPHPMQYCRAQMDALGVKRAADLSRVRNGQLVRIAGCVIVRQRPSTAKGFVFLSIEDETGIANAILTPDIFKTNRRTIVDGRFLLLDGRLQNVDDVVSVKVSAAQIIDVTAAIAVSHDFH